MNFQVEKYFSNKLKQFYLNRSQHPALAELIPHYHKLQHLFFQLLLLNPNLILVRQFHLPRLFFQYWVWKQKNCLLLIILSMSFSVALIN